MASDHKKILVTGCSGLIGRELFRQLQLGPHRVIGVDNNSRFDHVPAGEFIQQDLTTYLSCTDNDFDYVYHMAAINGTSNFYKNPNQVLENNVTGDLAVFNFAKQNPNTKLIYASSSEVIADTLNIPTPEETSVTINNIHNPRWSYRLPKILAENYLTNSDINYLMVRFFNIFSEHCGPGHFVHDQVAKLKRDIFELTGAQETRSFCYVTDAVAVLINIVDQCNRDVVNIGSNQEINIQHAADILATALNKQPVWTYHQSLDGSVQRRQPSLAKLKQLCPEFAPESFAKTIDRIKHKL